MNENIKKKVLQPEKEIMLFLQSQFLGANVIKLNCMKSIPYLYFCFIISIMSLLCVYYVLLLLFKY